MAMRRPQQPDATPLAAPAEPLDDRNIDDESDDATPFDAADDDESTPLDAADEDDEEDEDDFDDEDDEDAEEEEDDEAP